MSKPLIARNIGTCHWAHGISKFDGINPVTVSKYYTADGKWKFSVEKHGSEVVCVTRFNSIIYNKTPANAICLTH